MTARQGVSRNDSDSAEHATSAGVDGKIVYAVGDIHGRYDLFKELLRAIVADAEEHARGRQPTLILLGDYIDRGPQSAEVLAAMDWLRRSDRFATHLLIGNHERTMLGFLEDPASSGKWLDYGGDATLRSYGITVPPSPFDEAELVAARDDLLSRMPAAHLQLLQSLESIVTIGDYAFVHAGVRPRVPLDAQKQEDLLWIREDFLECSHPFEKRIVHGHTWIGAEPEVYDNRIGLDTGAYLTGVLTGIRLEDGTGTLLRAALSEDA